MFSVSESDMINTVRVLAAEMPSAANSGHPGIYIYMFMYIYICLYVYLYMFMYIFGE